MRGQRGFGNEVSGERSHGSYGNVQARVSLATTQEFYIKPIAELAGPAMAELETGIHCF